MAKKLTEFSDEELADVGGQPGSIEDYKRTMEFRRRELKVAREVADAQISAARWTRRSAVAVMLSVAITAFGIWVGWWISG